MSYDYPSNSRKSKEIPVQPTLHKAKQNTPALGKQLKEAFFTGCNGGDSIASYLVFDVAIPAMKDLIADMVGSFTNRTLYGSHYNGPRKSGRQVTNYSSFSSTNNRDERRSRPNSRGWDFSTITFDTRVGAEEVLSRLYDLANEYDYVSVGTFYQLAGVSSNTADLRWGWTVDELGGVSPRRLGTKGGYYLDLREPVAIR